MRDVAVLILRLVFGGLMAGHGSQKLFGWFGGHGVKGTTGWMESMGMKPGKPWTILAGASEFGGGVLTALGALNPLGPIGTIGAMGMATAKVHWGKPIWVTSGGAELPVTNMAIALALGLAGPGKISVDNALGLKLPRRVMMVPGLALAAAGVALGVMVSTREMQKMSQAQQAEAPAEQQQPGEERQEPVPVPVPEAPAEMERKVAQSEQQPDQVAGGELQAGQEAAHPA